MMQPPAGAPPSHPRRYRLRLRPPQPVPTGGSRAL